MRIYLSGPMTGIKDFNFPAFDDAAQILREQGNTVISPADISRERGFHEASVLTQNELRELFSADLEALCKCDHVVLLAGWKQSKGVMVELHLASYLGIGFTELDELVECVA